MVDAKICAVLYNELKTYSKRNGERDLQNEVLNNFTGSNPVLTTGVYTVEFYLRERFTHLKWRNKVSSRFFSFFDKD